MAQPTDSPVDANPKARHLRASARGLGRQWNSMQVVDGARYQPEIGDLVQVLRIQAQALNDALIVRIHLPYLAIGLTVSAEYGKCLVLSDFALHG